MSAAEALPLPQPEEPWRNSSHLPRPLSAADLAAAPPARPSDHAAHDAALPQLLTQAAWRPANVEEDEFLDALYQAHVDQAFLEHAEHVRDFPPVEPTDWS